MSENYIEHQIDVGVERYFVNSFLSNSYLIYSKVEKINSLVIVIDPHFSFELEKKLREIRPKRVYIALTHEHFDHTTGIDWLLDNYECTIICHSECGRKIANKRNNRPLSIMSKFSEAQKYIYDEPKEYKADIVFEKMYLFECFGCKVKFIHAPGHTLGSCCIEMGKYRFTGDSMILNTPVITRFPTGSEVQYQEITLPYLRNISEECIIAPGHGAMFKKSEVEQFESYFVKK